MKIRPLISSKVLLFGFLGNFNRLHLCPLLSCFFSSYKEAKVKDKVKVRSCLALTGANKTRYLLVVHPDKSHI